MAKRPLRTLPRQSKAPPRNTRRPLRLRRVAPSPPSPVPITQKAVFTTSPYPVSPRRAAKRSCPPHALQPPNPCHSIQISFDNALSRLVDLSPSPLTFVLDAASPPSIRTR